MVMLILVICSLTFAYKEIEISHDRSFKDRISEYLRTPSSENLQTVPQFDLDNYRNVIST